MYRGDFTTSNTVYILFDTFDSNDPSASVTITGLALADILIYKNGSVTERSSTAGFTLLDTDGIDFDTKTGIHGFSIDLSDNTDAGFYAAGGEYTIVVSSITVDAATVSFVAGSFSIERTGGALALLKDASFGLDQLVRSTTPANTLDIEAGGTAGIDWANIANKTTAVDLSGTDIQLADTVTTLTGHTAQTGDNFARLGAPAGASVSADIADVPTVAEFETRTPTAAQLAYIVANAATGYPVTFTTSGGSTTAAVLNQVDGSAGSATNDQYNGRLLVFTDGTLKGVVTDITDYVGSTTTATITAIPFAPTSSHNARLI